MMDRTCSVFAGLLLLVAGGAVCDMAVEPLKLPPPPPDALLIPQTHRPIAIDGALADWEGIPTFALANMWEGDRANWGGPDDASIEAGVCFDAGHLYMMARIHDDVVIKGGLSGYYGDGMQLQINDADNPAHVYVFTFSRTEEKTFPELLLVDGAVVSDRAVDGAEFAATDGDPAIYEMRIPWSALSEFAPFINPSFGIDIIYIDRDGDKRKALLLSPVPEDGGLPFTEAVCVPSAPPAWPPVVYGFVNAPVHPEGEELRFAFDVGSPSDTGGAGLTVRIVPQPPAGGAESAPAAQTEIPLDLALGSNLFAATLPTDELGPGEYRIVASVAVAGEQVAAGERRVTRYSRSGLRAELRELADRSAGLRVGARERGKDLQMRACALGDLRVDRALRRLGEVRTEKDLAYVTGQRDEAKEYVAALEGGRMPLEGVKGVVYRAYRSAIDDTVQPYGLFVPDAYDAHKPCPCIVYMRGSGDNETSAFRSGLATGVANRRGYMLVGPYGRGPADHRLTGERDILDVIDDVSRFYNVDPDRIFLTGLSAGGGAAWRIGLRYADRFAGIVPYAGWFDETLFEPRPDPAEDPLGAWAADRGNLASYAANAADLPVRIVHGADDSMIPVEQARVAHERLSELGYDVVYEEYAGEGHTSFLPAEWPRSLEWMERLRRNPSPVHVQLATYSERCQRAYWVTAGRRFDPLRPGRVTAEASVGNRIEVSTENIGLLTLRPTGSIIDPREEIAVTVDGVCVFQGPLPDVRGPADGVPAESGALRLGRDRPDSPWSIRASQPTGDGSLAKRAGLEGPVDDIFMRERLVIVSPDAEPGPPAGGSDPGGDPGLRREAARILRGINDRLGLSIAAVGASGIDEPTLAKANPIVLGTLADNSLLAAWAPKLPVQVSAEGISVAGVEHKGADVGCIFIAPSPANPDNYALIIAGVTEPALENASRLLDAIVYGALPDYAVFDRQTLDRQEGEPWRFLDWGFFDAGWRPAASASMEGQ